LRKRRLQFAFPEVVNVHYEIIAPPSPDPFTQVQQIMATVAATPIFALKQTISANLLQSGTTNAYTVTVNQIFPPYYRGLTTTTGTSTTATSTTATTTTATSTTSTTTTTEWKQTTIIQNTGIITAISTTTVDPLYVQGYMDIMIQELDNSEAQLFIDDIRSYNIFETTMSATVYEVPPSMVTVMAINHTNSVSLTHPRNRDPPIVRVHFMIMAYGESQANKVKLDLEQMSMNAFTWQLDRTMLLVALPRSYKVVTLYMSNLRVISDPFAANALFFFGSTTRNYTVPKISRASHVRSLGAHTACLCGALLLAAAWYDH
jgi:hypothetical protein